jgi:hypothetical protein
LKVRLNDTIDRGEYRRRIQAAETIIQGRNRVPMLGRIAPRHSIARTARRATSLVPGDRSRPKIDRLRILCCCDAGSGVGCNAMTPRIECEHHHTGLMVSDLDAATDFYTQKLGFALMFKWGDPREWPASTSVTPKYFSN